MREIFPGYYKPTEEEFAQLWDECIFVFDTNILLNVYRYSDPTRQRLFEILGLLKDRIWIPYQVAYEYQEERLNVISEQLKPYKEIQEVLNESLDKINSVIDKYRRRHSFTSLVDEDKIIKTFKRANKRVSKTLEETKNKYPDLIDNDIYRDKISDLFSDKIGTSYDKEKLQKICKQAKSRFDIEQPPGYKDKNKSKDIEKYGDAILWLQLIDYVKNQNKPVIFVTDDSKEDWWKIHKGKTISPRPELIQEMKTEAKIDFWMYTGDRFLMYAQKYLKLLEEPEVAKEAKEVRVNYDVPFKFPNLEGLAKTISLYRDEQLLMNNKSLLESFDTIRKQIPNLEAGFTNKLAKTAELMESFQINNSEIIAKAIKDIETNHPNLRKSFEDNNSTN